MTMWYRYCLLKFADLKDILKSIGVSDEVIEFVNTQKELVKNIIVGELKKDSTLTIPELNKIIQGIKFKKKKEYQANIDEKQLAAPYKENKEFYEWILRQLIKSRKSSVENKINKAKKLLFFVKITRLKTLKN